MSCFAQTLKEVPRARAEYIMWLDMDLLMNKMDFVMPLENYEGKDLVMHGQPEFILQGEARKGEQALLLGTKSVLLVSGIQGSTAVLPLHQQARLRVNALHCCRRQNALHGQAM